MLGFYLLHFNKNKADAWWLQFRSSISSNTSYGGATQECLPTEPGDNGTKLEGGWAGSRSNLRELNKSWPLKDFIVQNRSLLLCAVTESGATPLSVNSQSAAFSETCNTAQPTNYRLHLSWHAMTTWSKNLILQIPLRTPLLTNGFLKPQYCIYIKIITNADATTVNIWCLWSEEDEGMRTVCSQRWFITEGSDAADSRARAVRHMGRQDTATWQPGPNCHCQFLQSRLTRAQRISVSLLSQQKRLVRNY